MDWWRVLKIYAGGAFQQSCGMGNHSWVINEVDDSGFTSSDWDEHVLYVDIQCSKCGKEARTTTSDYDDTPRDEAEEQW